MQPMGGRHMDRSRAGTVDSRRRLMRGCDALDEQPLVKIGPARRQAMQHSQLWDQHAALGPSPCSLLG